MQVDQVDNQSASTRRAAKPPIDRARVAELVRSTLAELGKSTAVAPVDAVLLGPERSLATAFDADAGRKLAAATPARIFVGRAGSRYRTSTLLRFRADHAAAKDAVMSEVDGALLERLGLCDVISRAADKRVFLERPDAGRALSEEAKKTIAEKCTRAPQLQICYGDGLSAAALNAHLEAFHLAFVRELGARSIGFGTPLFIRHSRVKVMDEIARLTEAEACVFVCGERPGLGFADSMSAYYIYRPATGATDADREVISNINPRGLEPARAAAAVADACVRILGAKKSGVTLS